MRKFYGWILAGIFGLIVAILLVPSPTLRTVKAQGAGTQVSGPVAAGSRVLDVWPVIMGGSDGLNARALSVDASGRFSLSAVDPCASSAIPKNSVFVNITTATTTALVAVSGSTVVYSCGFQVTALDTVAANTILLEYGSGAACVTSPVALTPTYNTGVQAAGAIPYLLSYGPSGNSILKPTPTGQGVCAVTTVGTTPSINVLYTFVQQ